MNIIFFPKYTQIGPSSRYRIYQYLRYLKDYNCIIHPFFDDKYRPGNFNGVSAYFYVIGCYLKRLSNMLKLNKNDIVFVQYEFTQFSPFFVLFFKLRNIRYIVDYDDAVFHDYDQSKSKIIRKLFKNKIACVIKNANYVITGSPYLTQYALKYNKNVIEIPTSINLDNYIVNQKEESDKFIIGWIGSKTTSVNLIGLIPAFESLLKDGFNFEIRCIGFDIELLDKFSHLPFKAIGWKAKTEVNEIGKFDVGIMPLTDNPFNNGKCAFKLIQYMACGIPTISTPLEANIKVNRDNNNLFSNNIEEWITNFKYCLNNHDSLKKTGVKNRSIIEKFYTIQVNHNRYIKIFKNLEDKKQ